MAIENPPDTTDVPINSLETAMHVWLGIPQEEQPPNHYGLLGIPLFEGGGNVIESAADGRTAHLRSFQNPGHVDYAQRLLNMVSTARLTLLDPERRAAYDRELRQQISATEQSLSANELAGLQTLSGNVSIVFRQMLCIAEGRELTCYAYMGLDDFEESRQVIISAANRQIAHLRKCRQQSKDGKHNGLAQRLIRQVTIARKVLIDPDKKKRYDERLRKQRGIEAAKQDEESLQIPTTEHSPSANVTAVPRIQVDTNGRAANTLGASRSRSQWRVISGAATAAAAVAAVVGGIVFMGGRSDSNEGTEQANTTVAQSASDDIPPVVSGTRESAILPDEVTQIADLPKDPEIDDPMADFGTGIPPHPLADPNRRQEFADLTGGDGTPGSRDGGDPVVEEGVRYPTEEAVADQITKFSPYFSEYGQLDDTKAQEPQQKQLRKNLAQRLLLEAQKITSDDEDEQSLRAACLLEAYRLSLGTDDSQLTTLVIAEMWNIPGVVPPEEVEEYQQELLSAAIEKGDIGTIAQVLKMMQEQDHAVSEDLRIAIAKHIHEHAEDYSARYRDALYILDLLKLDPRYDVPTRMKIMEFALQDFQNRDDGYAENMETSRQVLPIVLAAIVEAGSATDVQRRKTLLEQSKGLLNAATANIRSTRIAEEIDLRTRYIEDTKALRSLIEIYKTFTGAKDQYKALADVYLELGELEIAAKFLRSADAEDQLAGLLKVPKGQSVAEAINQAQSLQEKAGQYRGKAKVTLLELAVNVLDKARTTSSNPLGQSSLDEQIVQIGGELEELEKKEGVEVASNGPKMNPLMWARMRTQMSQYPLVYSGETVEDKENVKTIRIKPEGGGIFVAVDVYVGKTHNIDSVVGLKFHVLTSNGLEKHMCGSDEGQVFQEQIPSGDHALVGFQIRKASLLDSVRAIFGQRKVNRHLNLSKVPVPVVVGEKRGGNGGGKEEDILLPDKRMPIGIEVHVDKYNRISNIIMIWCGDR